jgi:alpha-beta hydrolase superfamily lysophospholipase
VIVPGLAVSRYLRPTADRLAEHGVRCEVLDLPGFGASANPPRPLGAHEFAAVIADHLRERDGPPRGARCGFWRP